MGLLKSLRTRLSSRGMRGQQRNGKLQKRQNPSKDQEDEDSRVSRKLPIARKPLPLRAKVQPDVLDDSFRPEKPLKDGVNDVPASTIRLVGHERKDADTATFVKKASSRVPTTTDRSTRGGAAPSKLDPRAYWGEVPSLYSPRKNSEEKLNNGENKALSTPNLSSAVAGLSLNDSEDNDYHVTHAKAVTHGTIHKETTEIVQESVTREIHTHEYLNHIQPIQDVELLPERHFMHDVNGRLFEIPAPSGREIIQPVVGETYVDAHNTLGPLTRDSDSRENSRLGDDT